MLQNAVKNFVPKLEHKGRSAVRNVQNSEVSAVYFPATPLQSELCPRFLRCYHSAGRPGDESVWTVGAASLTGERQAYHRNFGIPSFRLTKVSRWRTKLSTSRAADKACLFKMLSVDIAGER